MRRALEGCTVFWMAEGGSSCLSAPCFYPPAPPHSLPPLPPHRLARFLGTLTTELQTEPLRASSSHQCHSLPCWNHFEIRQHRRGNVKVKVTQSCPTLCNPWTIQSMKLSRPEHCSGLPFPSSGDLPNPEIEPRSPALQADSLPSEPLGKLKIPLGYP